MLDAHRAVASGRRRRWHAFLREAVLIAASIVAYFGVRGLTEGSVGEALVHGRAVLAAERWLGMAVEERLQELVLTSSWSVTLANWVYIWGHWPVIGVIAVWLFFCRPHIYTRYRNAFLLSGAIGLVVFATYPVAPPRLLDPSFVDTITERSRAYRVLQPPAFVNQFAAMPSLHLGWDLLIALALFQATRAWALRVLALLLPVAMFAAIVVTANHYLLDGVAGIALALAAMGAVSAGFEWKPRVAPRAIAGGMRSLRGRERESPAP